MNFRFRFFLLLILPLTTIHAQDSDSAKNTILPPANSPWRVGGGYAQLFGLNAQFSGLGIFQSAFTPQPLGSGIPRNYDNGFVQIDSSGNFGNETWNWSYDDASQYNSTGDGSIELSITNSLANGRSDDHGDAEPGVELFAYYDMGALNLDALRDLKATWGFRGGLQHARINLGNQGMITSQINTVTDRFNLGGNIAPLAPYTGSFSGPGPLLHDDPTRTSVVSRAGLVSGEQDLDVDLMIATLGTYLAIPVTQELDFLLEAGISLGVASGSYDYNAETTIAGVGTQQSSGSQSKTDLLPGFYVGLSSTYQLTDQFSLIGSARYQTMESFDLETNGSSASLTFDSSFTLSVGVLYSF